MSNNLKLSRLYIKLGTNCNLHCKYCHAAPCDFSFNPAILPVLKSFGLKKVTFGGGEPLLYWLTIKQIVEYLGKDVRYKIITNGTLFTEDIVSFCNSYKFEFYISLDGSDSTRDNSQPILWQLIKKLKHCGTAVTFYRENQDIRKTLDSLYFIKRDYMSIPDWIYSSYPNFVHSTEKTGVLSDRELADSYIRQITEISEEALALYKNQNLVTGFLRRIFADYVKVKNIHGVRCCNEYFISILADGTICSCPYSMESVGDIFHLDSFSLDAIEKSCYRPQCKSCSMLGICRNYCHIDITDNFCYVMRSLHRNILRLMHDYGITYEDLSESLS